MPTEDPMLIITPERAGVCADTPIDLRVLVRVQAPDAPTGAPAARPPLNLALVIDRSGSMQGRPLEEAKRCASELVDRLSPRDRLAVIAYDDQVAVVAPSRPVEDRARLHAAIAAIDSGGSTALHAGWVAGAQQVLPWVRPDVVTRVLLLSDGQANCGLSDPDAIAAEAAQVSALGVATSTYGLGHAFNEDLMTRLARAGEGQAHYGETAEDLRQPFHAELSLLHALFAQRVTLSAMPQAEVAVSALNGYRSPAPLSWRLPALAYGAESWALLAVRAPAPRGRAADLLRLSVDYQDMHGRAYELRGASLSLPVLAAPAWTALARDELVARRAAELQAAALQESARAAALAGDWARVDALLDEARALAAASPWVGDVVRALDALAAQREAALFSKEARYAAHSMRNRLAAKLEAPNTLGEQVPDWVRRKLEQGKGMP